MTEPLVELQTRYAALLLRLRPDKPVSPVHDRIRTAPTHNGDAHVEVVDGMLHYVVTERGAELQRRVATDEDELLYWLMDDVTSSISWRRKASLLQRLLGRDPRRRKFAIHVRLLERVNPAWAARKKAHYEELLRRYPYRDRR
jgi:hypothetical protein